MRFRRRVKLLPGVHLNISGSGLGVSVGPRGASVSFGPTGTYSNVSIPGTGFYSRAKLSSPRRKGSSLPGCATEMQVSINLDDDGTVLIRDQDGNFLPPKLERIVKHQRGDMVRQWMQQRAEEINSPLVEIADIHCLTPRPNTPLQIECESFSIPEPKEPVLEKIGAIRGFLMPAAKRRVTQQNAERRTAYETALSLWQRLKKEHFDKEQQRVNAIQEAIKTDTAVMEEHLSRRLAALAWPRETEVSFEITDSGKAVLLDVDLPEIEDLPTKQATVPQRAWKVTTKELSQKQGRLNYMRHIHGVGFRLIGEVFAVLPAADTVTVSGYSQRPDAKTGNVGDEYLFSVRVDRAQWEHLNFGARDNIDPEEALTAFTLRRNATATGMLKPIEPSGLST
jgi:hypothetical protein